MKRTRNHRSRNGIPFAVRRYCKGDLNNPTWRHNVAILAYFYLKLVVAEIQADVEELKELYNDDTLENMWQDLKEQQLKELGEILVNIEQLTKMELLEKYQYREGMRFASSARRQTKKDRPLRVVKYCIDPGRFSTKIARRNSAIRAFEYLYTVLAKIETDIKELDTSFNKNTIENMSQDLEEEYLEEFKSTLGYIRQFQTNKPNIEFPMDIICPDISCDVCSKRHKCALYMTL